METSVGVPICAAQEMSASNIASTKANRGTRAILTACPKKLIPDIIVMKPSNVCSSKFQRRFASVGLISSLNDASSKRQNRWLPCDSHKESTWRERSAGWQGAPCYRSLEAEER